MSETTIAIANLTNQTTALLTEVTVQQGQVVAAARTQAQLAAASATTAATSATAATADANAADAARILAEAAKSAANTSALNAAAVVTGGTATVAPQAGKIPLADSEGNIADGWLSPESKAMGTSEFFALAEKRIRDGAGSGFAEWGKHYKASVPAYGTPINEGMYARYASSSYPDSLFLGGGWDVSEGTSRTKEPLVAINGVQSKLSLLGTSDSNLLNWVKFPPALDGTKTYDSATGVITDYTTDVDPKYSDVASTTNEAVARAFEGKVKNGDFRLGNDGSWGTAGQALAFGSGFMELDDRLGDSNYSHRVHQRIDFDFEAGKDYIVTVHILDNHSSNGGGATNNSVKIYDSNSDSSGTASQEFTRNGGATTVKLTFTASGLDTEQLRIYLAGKGGYLKFGSVSIVKSTEEVITSRQDFGFIESFHEKISDKDVVYPLGNVQYGDTTWEGIALSNSVVAQGYSAFGEWDTSTTGRGVVWSTLSAANKAKFIEDPENNIYSDGDDLIQVRYRVRVVEGLGDDWINVSAESQYMRFDVNNYVRQRGSITTAQDFTAYQSNRVFHGLGGTQHTTGQNGVYTTNQSTFAHNGLCFAVPLLLVQRRNQGAYHPSFNPMGTTTCNNSNSDSREWWFTAAIQHLSTATCFRFFSNVNNNVDAGAYSLRGSVSSNFSARPDDKFYDAIYASDVQDLRMSSKSLPLTEIREKYKRMAIAGEVRGFEAVPFTKVHTLSLTGGNTLTAQTNNTVSNLTLNVLSELGNIGYVEQLDGSYIRAVDGSTSDYFHMAADGTPHDRFEGQRIVLETKQTHKQANPTWTDIIGSPANIAATFPDGFEGQWIPQIPDGSAKNYLFNRKNLQFLSETYTGNDGASWGYNGSPTGFNFTTNTKSSSSGSTRVTLVAYETQAHFTEDAVNSKVLNLGGVFASQRHETESGGLIKSSLIGKVAIASTNSSVGYDHSEFPLARVMFTKERELAGNNENICVHTSITLASGDTAVKTLDYIASQNGVATLNYAYKEMVYDSGALGDTFTDRTESETGTIAINEQYHITSGRFLGYWVVVRGSGSHTALYDNRWGLNSNGDIIWENGEAYYAKWDGNGWGDNNQFEITNNQATQTDDNGNTVKYGTASFNTQYFVVEE